MKKNILKLIVFTGILFCLFIPNVNAAKIRTKATCVYTVNDNVKFKFVIEGNKAPVLTFAGNISSFTPIMLNSTTNATFRENGTGKLYCNPNVKYNLDSRSNRIVKYTIGVTQKKYLKVLLKNMKKVKKLLLQEEMSHLFVLMNMLLLLKPVINMIIL